jgi:hypothetical protein
VLDVEPSVCHDIGTIVEPDAARLYAALGTPLTYARSAAEEVERQTRSRSVDIECWIPILSVDLADAMPSSGTADVRRHALRPV